jgi:hypothetical protein
VLLQMIFGLTLLFAPESLGFCFHMQEQDGDESLKGGAELQELVRRAYLSNYGRCRQFTCQVEVKLKKISKAKSSSTDGGTTNEQIPEPITFVNKLVVNGKQVYNEQRTPAGSKIEVLAFDGLLWKRYDPSINTIYEVMSEDLPRKFPIDIRQFGVAEIRDDFMSFLDCLDKNSMKLVENEGGATSVIGEGNLKGAGPFQIVFSSKNRFLPTSLKFGDADKPKKTVELKYISFGQVLLLDVGRIAYLNSDGSEREEIVYECSDFAIPKISEGFFSKIAAPEDVHYLPLGPSKESQEARPEEGPTKKRPEGYWLHSTSVVIGIFSILVVSRFFLTKRSK